MKDNYFKKCPSCGEIWQTQKAFIIDELLVLNGYKADFEKLEYGMFFFTHNKESCHSTMVIEVSDFINLYNGEVYSERKTGSDECPRYCLDEEQIDRCGAICECAFVRELLQIIKARTI